MRCGNAQGVRGDWSASFGSCPKSPDWDSDVESWTESEGTSSSEQSEHNVESLALSVVGPVR